MVAAGLTEKVEDDKVNIRILSLKTLDTFGNCQRLVFPLDVSDQKPVKNLTQLLVEVVKE